MMRVIHVIVIVLGWVSCARAFMGLVGMAGFHGLRVIDNSNMVNTFAPARRTSIVTPRMGETATQIRNRIEVINRTKKITTAMRLVAAAKVRNAQDAVENSRPFSEQLQATFGALIKHVGRENINLPLLTSREVKTILLVGMSGDRGLCGGFNASIIKRAEKRAQELRDKGYNVEFVTIGKKISHYLLNRRDTYTLKRAFEIGKAPNAAEAAAVGQELLADYLSGEVDRVEVIYSKFVTLLSSIPSIRTILPLSIRGIEDETDEIFQLRCDRGKFKVSREKTPEVEDAEFPTNIIFEQDPMQILNSILPLYLNGQILRMLQESVASELAARMTSMGAATDNANELTDRLDIEYNRARQAGVTQSILEVISGADAVDAGHT